MKPIFQPRGPKGQAGSFRQRDTPPAFQHGGIFFDVFYAVQVHAQAGAAEEETGICRQIIHGLVESQTLGGAANRPSVCQIEAKTTVDKHAR